MHVKNDAWLISQHCACIFGILLACICTFKDAIGRQLQVQKHKQMAKSCICSAKNAISKFILIIANARQKRCMANFTALRMHFWNRNYLAISCRIAISLRSNTYCSFENISKGEIPASAVIQCTCCLI